MEQILTNKANLEAFAVLFKNECCLRCIFRFFRINTMEFYRDRSRGLDMVGKVSDAMKLEPSLLHNYDVMLLKQKSSQRLCRLCLGLLQVCDKEDSIKAICERIRQSRFEFDRFKFQVKVPNSTMLRFSQMVEFVRTSLRTMELTLPNKLIAWREEHLEIKTVLKWILAPAVAKELDSRSTTQENCLQVSLTYENAGDDAITFNRFHAMLKSMAQDRFSKKMDKVQKKIKQDKVDNLQWKMNNIEPTADNLSKILKIDSDFAFRTILNSECCPPVDVPCLFRIDTRCASVFLFGYYVKYSRILSQTPWVVNGSKLADSSIQEEQEKVLLKYFYPQDMWSSELVKFHSGGREDIDVRMLSNGRPFSLEFCSPRFNRIASIPNGIELITKQINKSPYIGVNRLEFTDERCLQLLKKSEEEKVKAYSCFVHFERPYREEDATRLNSLVDLTLNQKTPLRVLHRRTLMVRVKIIHRMVALPIDSCNMILNVLASAGTYIKEFVHGDLGRTLPNIGSLTNNQADIFQLDVLKIYEELNDEVIKDFLQVAQLF